MTPRELFRSLAAVLYENKERPVCPGARGKLVLEVIERGSFTCSCKTEVSGAPALMPWFYSPDECGPVCLPCGLAKLSREAGR